MSLNPGVDDRRSPERGNGFLGLGALFRRRPDVSRRGPTSDLRVPDRPGRGQAIANSGLSAEDVRSLASQPTKLTNGSPQMAAYIATLKKLGLYSGSATNRYTNQVHEATQRFNDLMGVRQKDAINTLALQRLADQLEAGTGPGTRSRGGQSAGTSRRRVAGGAQPRVRNIGVSGIEHERRRGVETTESFTEIPNRRGIQNALRSQFSEELRNLAETNPLQVGDRAFIVDSRFANSQTYVVRRTGPGADDFTFEATLYGSTSRYGAGHGPGSHRTPAGSLELRAGYGHYFGNGVAFNGASQAPGAPQYMNTAYANVFDVGGGTSFERSILFHGANSDRFNRPRYGSVSSSIGCFTYSHQDMNTLWGIIQEQYAVQRGQGRTGRFRVESVDSYHTQRRMA